MFRGAITKQSSGPSAVDFYTAHELPRLAARSMTHAYTATFVGMIWLFAIEAVARRYGFATDSLSDAAWRCLVPSAIGAVLAVIDRQMPISRHQPFLQGYVLMAGIAFVLGYSAIATGGIRSPYMISLSTMLYLWGLIMPGGAQRALVPVLIAPTIYFGVVGSHGGLADFDVRSVYATFLTLTSVFLSLAYAEVQERWRRGASMASSVDALTQLFNRRYLLERFAALHAESSAVDRPISVLAFDIDHFKKINDTHGHAVGDEVIRRVARVLAESTRAGDVSGRLGGEEFVLVLDGCDASAAAAVGERIRQTIEALSLDFDGVTLSVTVSIGVASQEEGEDLTSEELLNAADGALYESKRSGRNRVSLADAAASMRAVAMPAS